MRDELLARLDAGPTTIQAWANECYTDAAARIRALQSDNQAQAARIAELEAKLAAMTTWLENNQPDVWRRGMWEALRAAEKEPKT